MAVIVVNMMRMTIEHCKVKGTGEREKTETIGGKYDDVILIS